MEDDPKLPENLGDDGEDSSSEPGDEVYIVESIQGKRTTKKGVVEYFIKWKGYDKPEDNTWEPAINCQCPELIASYEQSLKDKEKTGKSSQPKANDSSRKRKSGAGAGRLSTEDKSQRDKDESKENAVKDTYAKKATKTKDIVSTSDSDSDDKQKKAIGDMGKDDASLPEPIPGKTYEVQKGKGVSAVLGVKKSDKSAGLVALVRYSDNNYELVPTAVLCQYAAKEIVSFYESRLRFF